MPGGSSGKTLGPPIFAFRSPATASTGIANHLAFEPLPGEVPEQLILRIHLRSRFVVAGRLPIRVRGHHQPVHRLDAPAVPHELAGQPVEQLRMRGRARPYSQNRWAWPRCRGRSGDARADSPSRAPVSGFFGSASQLASAARRPVESWPRGGSIFAGAGFENREKPRLDLLQGAS